jgi:hypothetical protein
VSIFELLIVLDLEHDAADSAILDERCRWFFDAAESPTASIIAAQRHM